MPQFAETQSVTVGDVKVTFLADGGGIVIPTALYPASTDEGWQNHTELLDENGKFLTSIGAFLVEIGDQKIAVDMAMGPMTIEFPGFGPFSGGKYMESLASTGVAREDVTDVVFSHLHLDHVGWTTIDVDGRRELMYPNARHLVTQAEWDFWYGGDNPAGPHPEFVQQPLADIILFIQDGDEIAPGMRVVGTPGHTPGHISLLIESGGQRLYLTADILHGAMQLQEPDWSVAFDNDPEQARHSRERMYAEFVKPNTLVGVNHFSNKVFGTISPDGDVYTWTPL
ncbi:MAG TPA: MBL fold metallo-hydrolase [Chloroflexi bacterium]|nr:MBL fold metallo-hydrolase [Chloroflexota bacterium]